MTSPIRLRALRAAQVASLSVGLASTLGCPTTTDSDTGAQQPDAFVLADSSVAVDAFASADAATASDSPIAADAGATDAGIVDDAAVADVGNVSDAGCVASPPVTQECCVLEGGFWDEASMFCAIAVPGPFVPPTLSA